MINANYGRKNQRISLFTGTKRLVSTALAVSVLMYVGARIDFDQKAERFLKGERQIAAGYFPVSLQRITNAEGKLEFQIEYEIEGKKQQQPIYSGAKGPQIGGVEYALDNLDFKKLNEGQAGNIARKALDRIDPTRRIEYIMQDADLSGMSKQQSLEYAKKAFDSLGPIQKYELFRSELEKLLR